MTHVPSPAEWKDRLRWQQVTSHDHSTWSLPTISDSSITYHCFWQPPVGWQWPCCLQVSSWQNIKYLLTINERNSTLGTIYKPSHEEEGNLLIHNKRPIDLYLPLLPWLTKPSEGASGHPVRMPFAGITTESRTFVCWDRVSIHLATTWNTRSARYQQAPQHVTLINPLFGQPLSSSSYSP